MEKKLLLYAARAIYAILVVVEASQAVSKIRDAFKGITKK